MFTFSCCIGEYSKLTVCVYSVGTFSMYQSFQMLGYRPYHMYECVMGGATQMDLFSEAIRCKYYAEGKPYGKAEFDKWLANFDVRARLLPARAAARHANYVIRILSKYRSYSLRSSLNFIPMPSLS